MKAYLAIFLILIAASARAQDPEVFRDAAALREQGQALQTLLRRHQEGRVDSAFTRRILREAKALEAQGLPAEPYLLKANEGLAKKVPPRRMAPALEASEARIRDAAALVDGAMAQGAQADSAARRRAVLQLQSALMSGRSAAELESVLKRGFVKSQRPSLLDLTEDAAGLGQKRPKKSQPLLPSLEFRSGSEQPEKAFGPKDSKPRGKAPELKKWKKSGKPELRGSENSQGPDRGNPRKFKEKKGRPGKGK